MAAAARLSCSTIAAWKSFSGDIESVKFFLTRERLREVIIKV